MTLRRLALTRAIRALAGRIVALTGVLVLAASSVLGASILCVGAGGHVSLESIDRDCCAEDLPSESAPSIRPADPCGPCVDFTLQASAFPMRSAQVEAAVPAAATLMTATSAFASCLALPLAGFAACRTPGDSARHAASSAPPRPSIALTRLHGTLLRC